MKRVWWLVALIVVALLSIPGCGGGDGPGPGEIRMDSFSTDFLPIPTKIVRATVRNKDNQMMGGVLVSFSTSAGQLCEEVEVDAREFTMECINTPNGPSIETNANGIADIYLILGSFPSATVTAMATGSHQREDVPWQDSVGTGTISASIQVYLVENIRLFNIEAGPTADTKTLRVLVTGPRETPLENVAVRFHSSGGQFVDHHGNPAPIPEVRSNRHGIAVINLKSTHPVTVTARADNKSTQFPVEF
ncbi:Ig-like domain-containing protein [Desulfonatronum parangueonense]